MEENGPDQILIACGQVEGIAASRALWKTPEVPCGRRLMANETYGNKNCTEILNTKDYTVPGGRNLSSAPCNDSSCVYLCKRKNANGVGTCIGPGKQAKCQCGLKNSNYNADLVLQESGVSIGTNFTQVEGRILQEPKKLVEPTTVTRWVVVNFSARCDTNRLIPDLIRCGNMKGIKVEPPYEFIFQENPQFRNAPAHIKVEKMFEQIHSKLPGKPKSFSASYPMEKNKAKNGSKSSPFKFNKRRADGLTKPVLGTGMDTQDTSSSVLLFFDKQRFMFNARESWWTSAFVLGLELDLFSDKTGTLTDNKMEFQCACIGGVDYSTGNLLRVIKRDTPSKPKMRVRVDPELLELTRNGNATEEAKRANEFFLSLAACVSLRSSCLWFLAHRKNLWPHSYQRARRIAERWFPFFLVMS
ncbi:hypothetical protein Bca4012_068628 [Brassica carinata]